MAGRKSLMHPVVEELRNGVPKSSSPLRRRSSIAHRVTSTDLEENDDEAERLVRRMEKNQPTPISAGDKRRSMGLGFVAQMSRPQIAERISQCIKLNAENKITVKNAFSLEMIDFMTYMIKKHDGNMSNLQVASTSLDVSAKIYGFRVDGVHTDILKMIGGLDKQGKSGERKDGEEAEENGEGPEGSMTEAKAKAIERRKKKKKKNILSTAEALEGKIEMINPESLMFNEGDSQTTDLLYQAILPHHANSSLWLNTHNDVILDTVEPSVELDIDSTPIEFPKIENFSNNDICAAFANFKFLGWSADDEIDSSPEKSQMLDDPLQFDLDASLPVDDEPSSNGLNYFDMENDDHTENIDRCAAIDRTGGANNIVNLRDIVQASKNNKFSEYSFFQDVDIQWAGPSHWKIRHAPKNLGGSRIVEGCGQEAVRRRKEVILAYGAEAKADCAPKFDIARSNFVKLQARTAKINWSEDKVTLPQDMHYDPLQCCRLYTRPNVLVEFPKQNQMNATHISDDIGDYNYDNENDTTDYCPNIDCEDQPASEECANNAGDFDEDIGPLTQAFTGSNLVEAPKINSKIFIPYSQRAKKIDMRQLKKCIWKILTSSHVDKENVESRELTEQENPEKVSGTRVFNEIYKNLPKFLNKANTEALSLPIAFISLLHLANEKTLEIKSLDDYSDLFIRQD